MPAAGSTRLPFVDVGVLSDEAVVRRAGPHETATKAKATETSTKGKIFEIIALISGTDPFIPKIDLTKIKGFISEMTEFGN